MKKVFGLFGALLRFAFDKVGFICGSLIFALLAILFVSGSIRKRYENVLISEAVQDEFKKVIGSKKGKENFDTIGEFMIRRGYSIYCGIGVAIVKILFGLFYAYGLRSEAMDGYGFDGFQVPFKEYIVNVTRSGGYFRIGAVVVVAAYLLIQFFINMFISKDCIMDTQAIDLITTTLCIIVCFVTPVGYSFFVLAFTIIELAIVGFNLTIAKKANMAKINKTIKKSEVSYETFKRKMDEDEKAKQARKKNRK